MIHLTPRRVRRDRFAAWFWGVILAALIALSVAGHAAVSRAHAQMPGLFLETLLPYVGR